MGPGLRRDDGLSLSRLLGDNPAHRRSRCGKARENRTERTVRNTQMARRDRREDAAEIGCHSKVAPLVKRRRCEAGPIKVHLPTPYAAAEDPDDITVPMIGAAVAILAHGAAELGENDNHCVPPIRAEPLRESR